MNTKNEQQAQNDYNTSQQPTSTPLPENAADQRQQAIEQEEDTARLRSERKSVEDGQGSNEPS